MDIQQIHLATIETVRMMSGTEAEKQARLAAQVSGTLALLSQILQSDMELTGSDEANAFVVRNTEVLVGLVTDLVRSIQEMDQAIGHDRIHLAFDLFEGARALTEDPRSPCETLIVLLGAIGHDIGRYAEEKIFGKPMATTVHAWLSAHLMESVLKQALRPEDMEEAAIWSAVQNRVLGCILAHFGQNDTSDPLRHYVQSVDRLAGIFGVRDFARNLACDMHLRGARFWPDRSLNMSWGMAPFNHVPPEQFEGAATIQESWTNVIHYVEAPIRTCFPLATERMQARADEQRTQAARLLMIFGTGIPRDPKKLIQRITSEEDPWLATQIFSPELVEYVGIPSRHFGPAPKKEGLTRWDKWGKVLPRHIWDAVWRSPEAEDAKPFWPSIPEETWGAMEWYIHSAWRFSGGEGIFRPHDLINGFLGEYAYTLPEEARSSLTRRILHETDFDGAHLLAYGFGFARAEASVQSRKEYEALRAIQGGNGSWLVSAVAAAIQNEPVFHVFELPAKR